MTSMTQWFSLLSLCGLLSLPHLFAENDAPGRREGPGKERKARKDKKDKRGMNPQERETRMLERRQKMIERLAADLQLSEAQIESTKNLLNDLDSRRKAMEGEEKALREKMKAAQKDQEFDEEQLVSIGEKLGGIKVKKNLLMRGFFNEFRKELTEEQLAKFNENRKKGPKKQRGAKANKKGPGKKDRAMSDLNKSNMSPDEWEKWRKKRKEEFNTMSPEEKEKWRRDRERQRDRLRKMTPQQRADLMKKMRQRQQGENAETDAAQQMQDL